MGTGMAGATGGMTGATGGMTAGVSGTLSAQDRLFLVRAADGNMAEVITGQMAMKKAANGETKQIAQQLVQEHGQAQNELMQLAEQKGVALPTMLGPIHQVISQALAKAPGSQFDQMFLGAQVEDHENTAALFQQEIASGQDPDVKAYAAKYLPEFVGHTAKLYGAASGVGVMAMRFRPSAPPMAAMMPPDTMGMGGMTSGSSTSGMTGGSSMNGGAGTTGGAGTGAGGGR